MRTTYVETHIVIINCKIKMALPSGVFANYTFLINFSIITLKGIALHGSVNLSLTISCN